MHNLETLTISSKLEAMMFSSVLFSPPYSVANRLIYIYEYMHIEVH